jgi:hypothetical protein
MAHWALAEARLEILPHQSIEVVLWCTPRTMRPQLFLGRDTIEPHVGGKAIPVRLCGIDDLEARHANVLSLSALSMESIF